MKYFFWIWTILILNYSTFSFGMEEKGKEVEERGSLIYSHSIVLENLRNSLIHAVEINDAQGVMSCYEQFQKLDLDWEKEAFSLQALPWTSDYKKRVGSQLFWDCIDTPHQNLLREALRSLTEVPSDRWEETYSDSTKKIYEIISRHPYFCLPARACALAVSAHYDSNISKLFILEYLRFLNPRDGSFFKRAHHILNISFRENRDAQEALKQFLHMITKDFIDPPEKNLNDRPTLEKMSELGLPHYDILLGDFDYREKRRNSKVSTETILRHYNKAIRKGDPSGYLSVIGLKNSIEGVDEEAFYSAQRKAFLWGCFKQAHLSYEDKDMADVFIDNLYQSLKSLISHKRKK